MAKLQSRNSKVDPDFHKIKNNVLFVKHQVEEYVDDPKISVKDLISIEDFLSIYLDALDITFAKFAKYIDNTPARLKKCITGERKFNAELALKFAAFFHTSPELWLQLDLKNDRILLESQKARAGKYKKYDYEKVLAFA